MGHIVEETARSRGHEIVSIIDAANQEDFNSEAFRSADVAIEFSTPSAAAGNVRKAFAAGVKVVSGTTAWFQQNSGEMKDLCSKGATLFWSSNFSIGVYLFSALNRTLARIMDKFPDYSVAVDEVHHCHKLDAPSGTAVSLAETIISQLNRKENWKNEPAPLGEIESVKPACDGSTLSVFSYRHDEVPGTHIVRYECDADRISIRHEAKNRTGFALGAVIAAEFTSTRSGLLGMDDLFEKLIKG